jgi:hypothetical protein
VFPQHLSSLSEKNKMMKSCGGIIFDTCGWQLYISFFAAHPLMCEFRLLSQNIELQPAGQNVAVRMWSQLEQMSAFRYGLKTHGYARHLITALFFSSLSFLPYRPILQTFIV